MRTFQMLSKKKKKESIEGESSYEAKSLHLEVRGHHLDRACSKTSKEKKGYANIGHQKGTELD